MTKHFGTHQWSTRTFVVLIAAIAFVLVAGGVSPASVKAAETSGVTSNSILIGSHQPLTGIAAPGYSEIAPAEDSVVSVRGEQGGVDGRKIQFKYVDDMYNPANTPTVVRQLVLQDDVFAIVSGLGTPTHQTVLQYLNTNRVPDLFVASGCDCWNKKRRSIRTPSGTRPTTPLRPRSSAST